MGNCGLGLAPTRPEHREDVLQMLINVEGMSPAALREGIKWDFETFPEYLALLERLPKRINVGALVGHSPVRQYVLGRAAAERPATADEVARMKAVVGAALDAGALGFSTSKAQGHVGGGGRPIPSRVAAHEEIVALASALSGRQSGMVEVATGQGMFLREFVELWKVSGRPVTWGALLTGLDYAALSTGRLAPDAGNTTTSDLLETAQQLGGRVLPQVSCRELSMQFHLYEPFPLAKLPSFDQILRATPETRTALYRDAAWRSRARAECELDWAQWWPRTRLTEAPSTPDLVGRTVTEIAAARESDPLDAVVDISLANNLKARFTVARANYDIDEVGRLLRDPRTLVGLSDAGAHADQLCDAIFATFLLGEWVRERRALSLEQAVWRITGHPASVLGLTDRGLIAPGAVADLVAFDPGTIGAGPLRRVNDLPAGADRLVADATGIAHTWVGGTAIVRDGSAVDGARPGRVVRA
jgi:N-acyl-D-aspartate/D-glutamate deacylase